MVSITPTAAPDHPPVAQRLAEAALHFDALSPELNAKLRTCLFDFIGCAFETGRLPWARQALALARVARGDATVIGAGQPSSPSDAAFANAVMGHGLVREDMHSSSISHLGIVIVPALLALAETRPVSGADFAAAAIVGYEAGARLGAALMDATIARIHRPTGICGPLGAAAAGARLWRLTPEQATSAIALAANATAGFNQWAHTGGSEMFFQAGAAARAAVNAVQLAAAGAFASPSALDGQAGLFAAHGKRDAAQSVRLFDGRPEIFSVYHKPVPACNFAQTPAQAALAIAGDGRLVVGEITGVEIAVSRAAAAYPGCDSTGPFEHALQAKMSIQYCVAQALLRGKIDEAGFAVPADPALHRLLALTSLTTDAELSAAYPAQQGAEVTVRFADGHSRSRRLADVVHADDAQVRLRFRHACAAAVGAARAEQIEATIERLIDLRDAAELARLLRGA